MRTIHRPLIVAFSLLLGLTASAGAQAHTFQASGQGNRIRFVSDAPLETMTGTSGSLTGTLEVDPNNLSTAHGSFTVPISSLRTGIDLRDEHLRSENWLDATRNPNATFEFTRVSGATRLQPGQETRLQLHGSFTIHGQSHNVVASARVTYVAGENQLRGSATFSVTLTEYNISVPLPVRLKVANDIRVTVAIRAQG